ncbi:MAG: glycosyltransferase family 4 protein [Planctomycetaceae bacterium]|nr:glycosyltransferase family 4 protein [Planctomycetaceae bacterium]
MTETIIKLTRSTADVMNPPLKDGTHALRGLRVLHVIDRLSMGGTQNLLMRSISELDRRGVKSQVCVLSSTVSTDESYRDRVQPEYLNFSGDYRNPLTMLGCERRLRDVVERVGPDLIHSYLWVSDFLSAKVAAKTSTSHISHIVDRRPWQESNRLIHRIRRSSTKQAMKRARTRYLAVSQAAKEFACEHMQYDPGIVAVAANGIDWNEFAEQCRPLNGNGKLVLGMAGRIEFEKGHQYLLQAVARLVEQGIPVKLRITGDGPLREETESFVRSNGLEAHVSFLGWVASVTEFYQAVDLFVVPSVNAEGLPTTILEAMASGCVVIASDVGGASEAIRHHVDGCLVPARDVDALVAEVARLAGNRDLLCRMGDSARAQIRQHFTTERMVDVICATYNATRKAAHG